MMPNASLRESSIKHHERSGKASADLFNIELIDVLQFIQLCDALAALQDQLLSPLLV